MNKVMELNSHFDSILAWMSRTKLKEISDCSRKQRNIFHFELKAHDKINNVDKEWNQEKNRIILRNTFQKDFVKSEKGVRFIDGKPDLIDVSEINLWKIIIILSILK